MLSLEMRLHDRIYIGDDVVIHFSKLRTDSVTGESVIRIGFDAPKNISIDRESIYKAKRKGGSNDARISPTV